MWLRHPTRAGAFTTASLAVLLLTGGCGSPAGPQPDPPAGGAPAGPAARAQVAAHAAAAKDYAGVLLYDLVSPAGEERGVMVVRASDGTWRVDVPGGALDGLADIALAQTASGLFHCALATPDGKDLGCVAVERLGPEVDPRVQRVFTDWLDVLMNRGAALAITAAAPLPGADGDCFAIEPSAAALEPPLDAGIYCYRADGVLTAARLSFGALTLVSASEQTLPTVELPARQVGGDPLPLASPPPPATPSPSPSPPASPTAQPGAP